VIDVVFTDQVGGNIVYTALYVDDAILISPSKRVIESVIAAFSRIFELKVRETTMFVGIEINRDEGMGVIRLSQASYVRKLLETFDMLNANPILMLMTVSEQFPRLDAQPVVKFPYREAVSSLLFAAMVTRPNIANAVSQLSQHLVAFGEEQRLSESYATCAELSMSRLNTAR